MTGNEYQDLAKRTMNLELDRQEMIFNGLLGLAGEVGEIHDYYKKHKFQGHQLVVDHVKEELGDVMWYIALMCEALYLNLDDVMYDNIEKLKKRYPDGFSVERSINR